jgi:hypothetical protein
LLDEFSIFLFKDANTNSIANINMQWIGKSTIDASISTIYLQIYNRVSGLWEDVDSDNTTVADTELTLSGSISSNVSNYYSGSFLVSCRIYQLGT